MSVVSVNEVGHDRGAGEDQDVRTNERTFIVVLDDVQDDPIVARDAPGVPNVNDAHPADPQSFVISKSTEETESRLIYFVSVDYSTEAVDDPDFPGTGGDPLSEYPKIVWSTRDIEIVAEQAIQIDDRGVESIFLDPVTNSALDPFVDPPLVVPDFLQVCTITRNERPGTDYNPNKVLQFQNTINRNNVRIAGRLFRPVTAWLAKYDGGAIQQREGVNFVNVTYQVIAARDTLKSLASQTRFPTSWYDTLLDQGLRELGVDSEGNTKRIAIKGADKKPITEPVNLDGKGAALTGVARGDSVYLQYRTRNFSNFKTLRLPERYSLTGN